MRKQRLFKQVAADAPAAALVADLEAPAADRLRHAVAPRHVGGAGAQDRHRAVAFADRPFERDQRVGLDAASGEGQDRLELMGVGADIAASEAENGLCLGDEGGVLSGVQKSLPRGVDDVLARPGEVGADVGRAALAAPDDVAGKGGERRPATCSAAVDAEHEGQGFSS